MRTCNCLSCPDHGRMGCAAEASHDDDVCETCADALWEQQQDDDEAANGQEVQGEIDAMRSRGF